MIDYTTWCAIRDGLAKHLGVRQVARDLGLNVKTVRRWRARPYAPRAAVPRPSKLDPFKGRIVGWLDAHPLSAQQVFQRLCEAGYDGGISIVKDYVRRIRPRPRAAFGNSRTITYQDYAIVGCITTWYLGRRSSR